MIVDFLEVRMQKHKYLQGVERDGDAHFYWRVSARWGKSGLRMRILMGSILTLSKNVGCRCKICKGSILKSQKKQDVDAIVHDRQA